MNWIEIKDVTPNTPRQVLLGEFEQVNHYAIGELGGVKNAPEIAVEGKGGRIFAVRATHWCELVAP
ncbi:MAG: hypothetical protein GY954_05150 [Alteromonas sp.]|nr:hypothetical protein [Alteromonas sp.]